SGPRRLRRRGPVSICAPWSRAFLHLALCARDRGPWSRSSGKASTATAFASSRPGTACGSRRTKCTTRRTPAIGAGPAGVTGLSSATRSTCSRPSRPSSPARSRSPTSIRPSTPAARSTFAPRFRARRTTRPGSRCPPTKTRADSTRGSRGSTARRGGSLTSWPLGGAPPFTSPARGGIPNHDTLLFDAKGGRPATFHKEYVPYPPGYVRRDGKPPRGPGYPVEDVWNASDVDRMDSIQIVSFSGEKVGYPTQKNEALVSRIVRASSNPDDLVLDCFVGSGTTAVVAEKLGRRWVACDASSIAVHTTRKRLLRLPRIAPLVVQRAVTSPAHASLEGAPRDLDARVAIDGRNATIELASFALPALSVPEPVRASVDHWSQWLDGWCIDWDHQGGALNAGSRLWGTRAQTPLRLSATHAYGGPGRYVALVKTFDVL